MAWTQEQMTRLGQLCTKFAIFVEYLKEMMNKQTNKQTNKQ